MGAKTWMLVHANTNVAETLSGSPPLDRDATLLLAASLFSKYKLEPIGEGDISFTCPPNNEVHIGCFPGVSILAAKEFAIDYPSKLLASFVSPEHGGTVYLHAMHSVVDWFAFAQWVNGCLIRSLSGLPTAAFWKISANGYPLKSRFAPAKIQSPVTVVRYPLPFHPLEMGEAALKEFFGYQLEGFGDAPPLQPESIPLVKFKRGRRRWKLW